MMNKIIVLDNGYFMFTSIYANRFNKQMSLKWQYLNMMIASLKRLAVTPDDLIIIAIDSEKGSWRKEIVSEYKSNRKDIREKQLDIDWDYAFQTFDAFLKMINSSTPFYTMQIDKLEADDIMAIIPKYFNTNEVILVTHDTDMEMLTVYPNVRIFSPKAKNFKKVGNPYRILEHKIKKEYSDNLITPIKTEEEYLKRKLVVDLINLPREIEYKVFIELDKLNYNKSYTISNLGMGSMGNRLIEIYNNHVAIEQKKENKQKKLF